MTSQISNVPDRVDILHRQASTTVFQMAFTLPNGDPDDITGRTYVLNVKKSSTSNTVLAVFSTGNGALVISDGPNGILDVTLSDESTPVDGGDWVYDLDETDGSAVTPIMAGAFMVPVDL